VDVAQTLQRLDLGFTVRDIMVPRDRLICAPDAESAPDISARHPDYNVIPITTNQRFTHLYDRDARSARAITAGDLIEAATGIGDLVEILTQRAFCFVLLREEIAGYVHFSDLNNPQVKLVFYVIFEAFERYLLGKLHQLGESELAAILGTKRLGRLKMKMSTARDNDANLGLENHLFLPEILRMSRYRADLKLTDKQIQLVRTFRNRISHAGWMLIQDRADLKRLAYIKEICLSSLAGETLDDYAG